MIDVWYQGRYFYRIYANTEGGGTVSIDHSSFELVVTMLIVFVRLSFNQSSISSKLSRDGE